jgi:hypothetical protein
MTTQPDSPSPRYRRVADMTPADWDTPALKAVIERWLRDVLLPRALRDSDANSKDAA